MSASLPSSRPHAVKEIPTRRFLAPALLGLLGLCSVVLVGCQASGFDAPLPAPALAQVIDGVEWRVGSWEPHLPAGSAGLSWGNHRAVVEVDPEATMLPVVRVTIPWRRPDLTPERKAVVVVDAASGEPVPNAVATRIDSHSGDVAFEPISGSGVYHVYYLPWESTGGYYPRVTYPEVVREARSDWAATAATAATAAEVAAVAAVAATAATAAAPAEAAPAEATDTGSAAAGGDGMVGRVVAMESVDAFHSFFPMEVVASEEETGRAMSGRSWALFAEHRDRPISLTRAIPVHWTQHRESFKGRALRGEYFTFQVGVFAYRTGLDSVRVVFEGFPEDLAPSLTCFNCGGIDLAGEPFDKEVSVDSGRVQALWFGLQIPEDARPGSFAGRVLVEASDVAGIRVADSVDVSMTIESGRVGDGGNDHPEFMSRLAWLNSTIGTDPDFVIDPFTPVESAGKSLSILGRRVDLGAHGLPEQIWSYFTPELTGLADSAGPILRTPMDLEVSLAGGPVSFVTSGYEVAEVSAGRAEWRAISSAPGFDLEVDGALEYDGMLDYRITLRATAAVDLDDIALPVVYQPDAADYMLGLGRPGGRRPDQLDWTWKIENHQEGIWLGSVHKGLQYVLRDDNYVRPLNTNFYLNQPLNMPPSWHNEGKGGISIRTAPDRVVARNYSGPRRMEAGEELHFNIRFLITPFKPIDTAKHFQTRFVHKYVPVDSVQAWGGTVVNIHHANEINPYINYPFFNLDLQTAYIQEAHEKGIKVKLYNTIRELTYRAHELRPMRSLGDEIFNGGEGGGHSWMQEHLREDYHSAWHAWRVDDAAILNKGTSRWTNYYIAGLSWLAKNQQIDGLYLDDIAFSRETVKRLVSVLHAQRDEVVIDLHSANQFNPRDGFTNSAMLYMEHFPFISRLWFGEYFDYGQREDYWMTEVAGLPFGLMGEMLQGGGHPYRGMLYGMTTRMYGDVDPRPVWGMMNDFGIDQARMLGYWLEDAPVRVAHPDILATSFVREGGVLIALASWSDEDEVVAVELDVASLGLMTELIAEAPSVFGLQEGGVVDLGAVRVPAGQGIFLIVRGGNSP